MPDVSALTTRIQKFFFDRPEDAVAVYLFGSRARGDVRANSDVDIAVLFRTKPPQTLEGMHLDLAADLADELGANVDLIVLNYASPDLVHRILRDGELLVDRNRSLRIQFEVSSRSQYFDLQPVVHRYRKRGEAGR